MVREETVRKIDGLIYKWLFHGETITPNKINKLGVNPKSAKEYVEEEIPRYVGENKRARRVRQNWGYVEGMGSLKVVYIGDRIDNVLESLQTLAEKGFLEAREQLVFKRRLIRYARAHGIADHLNPGI
jgi:hypothetical protein